MGKSWDSTGIAYSILLWSEVLRVLKPGGHLLSFGGSRTYHRMACAIEDAGFEIRDQIMWVYGSGFPKSMDVSKAIDKAAGAERICTKEGVIQRGGLGEDWDTGSSDTRPRYDQATTDAAKQWDGWGTALKPAHEPIVVARKPLIGTVAYNVQTHGTGAINIAGCRVGTEQVPSNKLEQWSGFGEMRRPDYTQTINTGRWPANLIHDGSDEVVEQFPYTKSGSISPHHKRTTSKTKNAFAERAAPPEQTLGDSGSASRFFYCAKANKKDREEGNVHPTVKPTDLMRYLCRLVTPSGGTVLDPFMGSGSTGKGARLEGFNFIGIEKDPVYLQIAQKRISAASEVTFNG